MKWIHIHSPSLYFLYVQGDEEPPIETLGYVSSKNQEICILDAGSRDSCVRQRGGGIWGPQNQNVNPEYFLLRSVMNTLILLNVRNNFQLHTAQNFTRKWTSLFNYFGEVATCHPWKSIYLLRRCMDFEILRLTPPRCHFRKTNRRFTVWMELIIAVIESSLCPTGTFWTFSWFEMVTWIGETLLHEGFRWSCCRWWFSWSLQPG